ncbi:hypothetical protein SCHPADRAFT_910733 [Schizopora paradoxa]|uniref:Actin-like ATPase domain-containing protein n=1 Tax=Schizopora paradoxa TaxID=27342 RepID=A0A0H2RLY2_9AGAM|nr:hypothetical protein SCHPADRAFT_910733 [Schizopora paradoxa]
MSGVRGVIQSGIYYIQNVATKGYLVLTEGDDDCPVRLTQVQQNDVKGTRWNVQRHADKSYSFQNEFLQRVLDCSSWPEHKSLVTSTTTSEKPYPWTVREIERKSRYIVYPIGPGKEICWSFPANANENAQLRITTETNERTKEHAEWCFFLADKYKPPVQDPVEPTSSDEPGIWTDASKLVLSVDIGSMQSAVSFVYLEQNKVPPEIRHVTGWPGEPLQRAKTSSLMYYDANGTPSSFGAVTDTEAVRAKAASEKWTLVTSFKRYVHRLGTSAELSEGAGVPPLPNGVDEKQLYTDWLTYLFKYSKAAISKELPGMSWEVLSSNMEVVFTVPNGWYFQEHAVLRGAAVAARIVENPDAVNFVPETEAAVHWALRQGDLKPEVNTEFIVCDSGGSTTDIAMYEVESVSPLQLREKKGNPSKCIEAGAVLINGDFDDIVRTELSDKKFGEHEIIEAQYNAQKRFEVARDKFDGSQPTFKFDVKVDNNTEGDGSQIEITREQMGTLFDKVIDPITAGIDYLMENNKPKFLLLRGDFSCSPYFQKKLRAKYGKKMKLIPTSQQNFKAGAAGALVWFEKRGGECGVVGRATRYAYGVEISVPYDSANKEHVKRGEGDRRTASGRLKYGWGVLVPFGTVLKDGEVRKKGYELLPPSRDAPMRYEVNVYLAEEKVKSKWVCDRNGNQEDGFREICTIKADLSGQRDILRPHGDVFALPFEIAIAFGSTTLEAHVLWKEGDKECKGPVEIIPAEFNSTPE